ncbi:MAG: flagellar filament capping protein FliD [Acidobacteriota bacterium]
MDIGAVTFGGLFSGLDVNKIVDAVIEAESVPLDRVQARQASLEAQQVALEEVRAALSSLRFKLKDVATLSVVAGHAVSSSDKTVLTSSATSSAQTGTFQVNVLALAAASKVKSNEVTDRFAPVIADGTVTVQSGTKTAVTVTVSAAAGNNTLVGVRDSINAADAGVRASIVTTGTGEALIVRSDDTGTKNALTITDTTSLGLADAGNQLLAAADASVNIEGLSVTSSSNSISGALEGVTLDLVTTGTASITVSNDTEAVRTGLQEFIDEYNSLVDVLSKHTDPGLTPGTEQGVLFGDSTTRRIQQDLASLITSGGSTVPDGTLRSLAALGVDIDGRTGKLSINSLRLDDSLANHFADVKKIFLSAGTAADAAVLVQGAGFGAEGTYAVQITQAARQAKLTGSTAIQAGGLAAAENLTITVGTASVQVALAAGDTITNIVGKINTALQGADILAIASDSSGSLTLTTKGFGSAATLTVVSDVADNADGASTGIGTTLLNDAGVDVAGTINGEAATGVGQVLTADVGTVADGLALRILADATAVTAKGGDFGTVTVTHGLRRILGDRLSLLSDPFNGAVSTVKDGLGTLIRSLSDQSDRLEERLAVRRAFLVKQFNAAEQALAQLQASQNSLNSIGIG